MHAAIVSCLARLTEVWRFFHQEMEKRSRRVQYLVTLCVCVATVTMGMTSAWPTPVIPKFHANETKVEVNKDEIAWMLAMSSPGFMAGSFISGLISDRFGRRATLLWSALPYGAGMVIVACALKSWLLYLTQFLWSCGTGMLSTVMAMYLAEISDKEIRGALSLITKFTFNLGNLLTMCIGPFLSYETLNFTLLAMPITYFIAFCWIPETPYFYLKEGKVAAAKDTLMKLRGYKSDKSVEDELIQMQAHVRNEMRHSTSPKELFTGRQYRRAITIAAGLKVAQIMTGAVTIQQYLGLIMKESGIHMKLATVIIIFGAVRFVVSIMPSILADRVGRRPLLIYSFLGTSICLFVVGIYFFLMEVVQIEQDSLTPYGFITFTGIVCSNIISTIGFQSIIIVLPGEIFPLNVKSVAMTSLSIFGGCLSFFIARGYQILKDFIVLCGVFWVFGAVALSGAIFSLFLVPETKGKSLCEIQKQIQGDLYEVGAGDDDKMANVQTDDNAVENRELEVLNKRSDNVA